MFKEFLLDPVKDTFLRHKTCPGHPHHKLLGARTGQAQLRDEEQKHQASDRKDPG